MNATVLSSAMATEVQIPSTHKAVIYSDVGTTKTEVVELPVPEPGPGEVLVKL